MARATRAGRLGLVAAVLACAAAPGCHIASSRMWADTALPDGRFSAKSKQWAYDGEPVTFELECDPGAVNYVVFGVDGDETVIGAPHVEGRYRWQRAFHCGAEPETYEVYAIPFLLRGECDWVRDKIKDTWVHYPGRTGAPDVQTAKERRIRITCYRRRIRMPFEARGGPPREVVLTLTAASGRQCTVPPRDPDTDAAGFDLLGPDEDGEYVVTYAPTHEEVSRSGTTQAELVVRHADGSTQRVAEKIETP